MARCTNGIHSTMWSVLYNRGTQPVKVVRKLNRSWSERYGNEKNVLAKETADAKAKR